ncbi:MAG: hypothetical protein M3340_03480 [Actinomycetota bacterium]|nr:hypothetical protein [Actinomycetota bacterium]
MDVDLVVNCFERTYRDVLAPGFLDRVVAQNRFRFARRVVLVNNVEDPTAAGRLARARLAAGEIDAVHRVADRLPAALRRTGLREHDLGAGRLHSIPSLVAVTLEGAPWVVHWDAEIGLTREGNWIAPGLEAIAYDDRVIAAAPHWDSPKLEPEVVEAGDRFDLCLGFSDHVYLARRSELARPIYSTRCVVRRRYPLCHRGYTFESRLDAYMRHHGRLRAIDRVVSYRHDDAAAGASYPAFSPLDRVRVTTNRALIGAIRTSPLRPACCRTLEREDPVSLAETHA